MNTDKLLKTLPHLQQQIDALLEFDCTSQVNKVDAVQCTLYSTTSNRCSTRVRLYITGKQCRLQIQIEKL